MPGIKILSPRLAGFIHRTRTMGRPTFKAVRRIRHGEIVLGRLEQRTLGHLRTATLGQRQRSVAHFERRLHRLARVGSSR